MLKAPENGDILDFQGYLTLANNDKDLKVFFDEDMETDIIEAGFLSFDRIDEKTGKKRRCLFNKNIVRFIDYEIINEK